MKYNPNDPEFEDINAAEASGEIAPETAAKMREQRQFKRDAAALARHGVSFDDEEVRKRIKPETTHAQLAEIAAEAARRKRMSPIERQLTEMIEKEEEG